MERDYRKFHVVTVTILIITLLIITFLNDNPLIELAILNFIIVIYLTSGKIRELKKGIVYFIPFTMMALIINMIFSSEGNIVLFNLFGKSFTLEALIYSIILSFKLILVVYLFLMLNIMVDSDKAAAYFLSKMPKSALTFLIGFKLIPGMKRRLKDIKEIYEIRGVDFQGKKLKERVSAYVPILSILLEDSLEGAFDIGEAAFIRGFLSSKRSIYDKQHFEKRDYIISFYCLVFLCIFVLGEIFGLLYFNVYSNLTWASIINFRIIAAFSMMVILTIIILIVAKEIKDDLLAN